MQYNLSSILFRIVVHLQWRNYGACKPENFAIVNVPLFRNLWEGGSVRSPLYGVGRGNKTFFLVKIRKMENILYKVHTIYIYNKE